MNPQITTRLPQNDFKRFERVVNSTLLRPSDVTRIAVLRLIDTFEQTGRLELGPTQQPAQPETASA